MKRPLIKENLLDKALEFVAPRMAVKRRQARMVLALSGSGGGYSGASKRRTALSNWQTSAGSAETDISPDLPNLRERSRDLVRNTPIATGAVELATTHVIGTGLAANPNPNYEFLKLSEEQASAWVKEVKREWALFANSKDVDIGRRMNFYQCQSLVFRSRMESGDVVVLTPNKDRKNAYSLCLQIIEADRISNPNRAQNTDKIIDGIEVDEHGAPINCHISNKHPGAMRSTGMKWTSYPFYSNTGRRNVLHLFKPLRPGQVRGVPDFAPVIEPLKQLGRYTEAELQAAVISGMFSVFVTMDQAAFEGLFDETSQKEITSNASKWDGNLDNGGKAVNLLPGETVESSNPGRPNSEFDPFVQSIIRQIGMALGIPYEVLIMHYQSSYTAARGALLMAWRTFRIARDWMATDFCQPVYELWLEEAVARNRIKAPGFFMDPAVRAAWCNASWIGDGPGSVDPVKEVDAAEKRIDLGISTREAESILHDGGDYATKHTQLVREKNMRDKDKLTQQKEPAANTPSNNLDNTIDNNGNDSDQEDPAKKNKGNQ